MRQLSDHAYTCALPNLCSLEAQGEGLLGEERVSSSTGSCVLLMENCKDGGIAQLESAFLAYIRPYIQPLVQEKKVEHGSKILS